MLPARRNSGSKQADDNLSSNVISQQQQQQSSSKNNCSSTAAVLMSSTANTNDTYNDYENENDKQNQFLHKSKSDIELPHAAAAVENDNISIASTADTYKTAQQCSNASSVDDFYSVASSTTTNSSSTTSSTTELAATPSNRNANDEAGNVENSESDSTRNLLNVGDAGVAAVSADSSSTTFARKSSNLKNRSDRASLDTLHDVENMMDEQQVQQEQEALALRRELAARATTPVANTNEETPKRFRGWSVTPKSSEPEPEEAAATAKTVWTDEDDVENSGNDTRTESHAKSSTSDDRSREVSGQTQLESAPLSPSFDSNHSSGHIPIVRLPSSVSSAASEEYDVIDYDEPLVIEDDEHVQDPLFIRESNSPQPPTLRPILKKSRYEDFSAVAADENIDDVAAASPSSNATPTSQQSESTKEQNVLPNDEQEDLPSISSTSPSPEPAKRRNASGSRLDADGSITADTSDNRQQLLFIGDGNGHRRDDDEHGDDEAFSSTRRRESPSTATLATSESSQVSSSERESQSSHEHQQQQQQRQQQLSGSSSSRSELHAEEAEIDCDVDETVIAKYESEPATVAEGETNDVSNNVLSTGSKPAITTVDICQQRAVEDETKVGQASDSRTLSDAAFQTTHSVDSAAATTSNYENLTAKQPSPSSATDETTYVLQLRKRSSIPLPLTADVDDNTNDGLLEGETSITRLEIAENADNDDDDESEETEALTITEIRQRHAEEFAAVESDSAAAAAADAAADQERTKLPKIAAIAGLAQKVEHEDENNLALASISPPSTPTADGNDLDGKNKKPKPLNLDDETGSQTTTDPECLSVIDEESEPVNTEDERERNLLRRQQSSIIDEDENAEPLLSPMSPTRPTHGFVELPASDTNSDAEMLVNAQIKRKSTTHPPIQPLRRTIVLPQRRKMLNLDQFVAATEHNMSDYVSNSAYLDDFPDNDGDAHDDEYDDKNDEEDDAGPREFGEESVFVVSPLDLERASLKSGSLYNSSSGSGRGGIHTSDDTTLKKSKPHTSSVGSDESSSRRNADQDDSGSGTISTSSVEEEDIPVIHIPNQIQSSNLMNLTDALSYGEEDEDEAFSHRLKPLHKLREPTTETLSDDVEQQTVDIKQLIQRFELNSSGASSDEAATPISETVHKDAAPHTRAEMQQVAAKESLSRLTASNVAAQAEKLETPLNAETSAPIAVLNDEIDDDDAPAWKKAYKKRLSLQNSSETILAGTPLQISANKSLVERNNENERSSPALRAESRSGSGGENHTPSDNEERNGAATLAVTTAGADPLTNGTEKDEHTINTPVSDVQDGKKLTPDKSSAIPSEPEKSEPDADEDETSQAERDALQKLVDKYESASSVQRGQNIETNPPAETSSTVAANATAEVDAALKPTVTTVTDDIVEEDPAVKLAAMQSPKQQPPPIPPRPAMFHPTPSTAGSEDSVWKIEPQHETLPTAATITARSAAPEPRILSSKAAIHLSRPVSQDVEKPSVTTWPSTSIPSKVAHKQFVTKPSAEVQRFTPAAEAPESTVSQFQVILPEQTRNLPTKSTMPFSPITTELVPQSQLATELKHKVTVDPRSLAAADQSLAKQPYASANNINVVRALPVQNSRSTSSVIIEPSLRETGQHPLPNFTSTASSSRAWPPTNVSKPYEVPVAANGYTSSATDAVNILNKTIPPPQFSTSSSSSSSMCKKSEEYTTKSSSWSSSSETVTGQKPQNKSAILLSWPPRLPETQNETSSISSSISTSSKPVTERSIPVTVIGADGLNRRVYGRAKTSPLLTSISIATSSDEEARQQQQKPVPESPRLSVRSNFREHSIPITIENGGLARKPTSTVVIATRATPNTTTYQHRDVSSSLQSQIESLEAAAEKLQEQISPFTYFQQLAQQQKQPQETTSSRRVRNEYSSNTNANYVSYKPPPAQSYTTASNERVVPISIQPPRRSSFGGDGSSTQDSNFDLHLAQQTPVTLSYMTKRNSSQQSYSASQYEQQRQRDSSIPMSSSTMIYPNKTDALNKLPRRDFATGGSDPYRYVVVSDYVKGQLVQQTSSSSSFASKQQQQQHHPASSTFVQNFQNGRKTNPNERVIITEFGNVSQAEIDALYEASKDSRLPLQSRSNNWVGMPHNDHSDADDGDERRHQRRQNGGEVSSEYREVINMLDECMKNMSKLLS